VAVTPVALADDTKAARQSDLLQESFNVLTITTAAPHRSPRRTSNSSINARPIRGRAPTDQATPPENKDGRRAQFETAALIGDGNQQLHGCSRRDQEDFPT
jgi:hypothetical protein